MKKNIPLFSYKIDDISGFDFKSMCSSLVQTAVSQTGTVVRMVFFGNTKSQKEYIENLSFIEKEIKDNFGCKLPVFSYVAQTPLEGGVVLETTRLIDNEDIEVQYKTCEDIPYIKITTQKENQYLFVGGVMAQDIEMQSISTQCDEVFMKIENLLKVENFTPSDIVRQWNYIERIISINEGQQNYQCLNDSRSHFYLKDKWKNGYPAATGIGTDFGGIVIDFDAIKSDNIKVVTLDNKLQVPAHDYSQNVLLGIEDKQLKCKTTPKFERGKSISSDSHTMAYISGTAAIRGEFSLENVDVIEQTAMTMENIDYLVSIENLKRYGVTNDLFPPKYQTLRVYIKHPSDVTKVKEFMDVNYPTPDKCYLFADVCREELLVEIEGITLYLETV